MCDALKHGGPDDEGIFLDNKVNLAFGNRRLSIIDLSSNGHQPMTDTQEKAWITFNGEIYNYRELREQLLKAGSEFHSDTDTEVILAAYLKWGTAAFSKLHGMFAFALYDSTKSLTYLVRDTTGIKPLYYYIDNEQLSFASEIKAFKSANIVNEADSAWPVRFLAFGHIPEPYTTLKNVFSLTKGHFLSWNHLNNTHCIKQYCAEMPAHAFISSPEVAGEYIRNSLTASVSRQLISDAPIGVFLSGGIDSSIITLLANQQREQQLKTISIYFDEKTYDERAFQDILLKQITGEKFSHLVKQQDFENFFPTIIRAMDMPTTDGINIWFISKYAHENGLKAVLSGIGADELFGGYPSYSRIKYLRYLRKMPGFILTWANYFGADRYRKVSFLAHNNPIADYLLLRGLFVPEDIASILDTNISQVNKILFESQSVPDLDIYDEKHAAWFETNLYMQNQLLRDTDVMSMSHGLEVRVPFLDEDFQETVEHISPRIRFDSRLPKKVLINSFREILPEAIWNRPKMGFTFPLQEWMSQYKAINDPLLYQGKAAQNAFKRFNNGQMHWSKFFALYQLQTHG
ncbi:MAG: asparagine synthase (glutamine-hydrolyzing) [Mucilaginibacter sp.]